jgi:hypothetical protein
MDMDRPKAMANHPPKETIDTTEVAVVTEVADASADVTPSAPTRHNQSPSNNEVSEEQEKAPLSEEEELEDCSDQLLEEVCVPVDRMQYDGDTSIVVQENAAAADDDVPKVGSNTNSSHENPKDSKDNFPTTTNNNDEESLHAAADKVVDAGSLSTKETTVEASEQAATKMSETELNSVSLDSQEDPVISTTAAASVEPKDEPSALTIALGFVPVTNIKMMRNHQSHHYHLAYCCPNTKKVQNLINLLVVME